MDQLVCQYMEVVGVAILIRNTYCALGIALASSVLVMMCHPSCKMGGSLCLVNA